MENDIPECPRCEISMKAGKAEWECVGCGHTILRVKELTEGSTRRVIVLTHSDEALSCPVCTSTMLKYLNGYECPRCGAGVVAERPQPNFVSSGGSEEP